MEERLTKTKMIIVFLVVLYASTTCTYAANTISPNQPLRYNETIVSPQETFELGFFSPGKNTNHYVGIWYKKISFGTVVWVANRNTPLKDTSVELTLSVQGVFIIRNATTGNIIWSSTNSSNTSVKNPMGQLLDSGNLIIYEEGDPVYQEEPIWQSFDFMTDTILPGMKHGRNLVTGIERHITSWKSDDDPAEGEYSDWIDTKGYPQLILTKAGKIIFRAGPWNGLRFTGTPNLKANQLFNFTFVINQKEIYYQYNLLDTSIFMRLFLRPNGRPERLIWTESQQEWAEWNIYLSPQRDRCDDYAACGPFGSCNIDNSPVCSCLKGFEPVSPDQWRNTDWTQGCRHTMPLDCNPDEGFNPYFNLKLPDTQGSWYNQTMTLVECKNMCKRNCSCSAYTNSNFSGAGSGCLLWFGDLVDIKTLAENGGTIYIRLSASELESIEKNRSEGRRVIVIVLVTLVGLAILVSTIFLNYRSFRKKQQQEGRVRDQMGHDVENISGDEDEDLKLPLFGLSTLLKATNNFSTSVKLGQGTVRDESGHDLENRSADEDLELPLFGLSTILKATNNFSANAKLGEGGFGPVYKGVLDDGQEIAVKRLAETSTQGLREFKNEVILISKLQHRNLVKLLGCCVKGVEKMLIYEYMPNKGLDSFIFDITQEELLDWHARFHIINGIARGLLYLHQDSRLRIVHRDLKVSNILLDKDMNPKISDFGLARIFGGNQIEANTNRVVGTYGYMAPEYVGDGIFSIKSDVYSFGVLVLEIVSGQKNRGFVHEEHCNNLIGHAWVLHNEDRSLQLVDKCLNESINVSQVLRSIHVGLLCAQRLPEDRPTMTSVIMMLGSEGPLPSPKEPGFYVGNMKQHTTHLSFYEISSNELSISMLNGR